LRENLAASYARNADYVVAAERELVESGAGTAAGEASAAATAAHRLDDAYRQALVERALRNEGSESIVPLVAGAARVRRAAQSLSALAAMTDADAKLTECGANLDAEVHALRSWYVTLGDAIVRGTTVPAPHVRDAEGERRLIACVRAALESGDRTRMRPAVDLIWANEHLDALWVMEEHLGRHAAQVRSA